MQNQKLLLNAALNPYYIVLNSVTQGLHQNLLGSFEFYAYCNITKTLYNAINGLVHTHFTSVHSFG